MSDLYELVFDQSGRPLLKPVESPQGPEQGLVAQTAKQAERQGAAEGLREKGRVAPGTEEAVAIVGRVVAMINKAASARRKSADRFRKMGRYDSTVRQYEAQAEAIESLLKDVGTLLPTTDSGGNAGE